MQLEKAYCNSELCQLIQHIRDHVTKMEKEEDFSSISGIDHVLLVVAEKVFGRSKTPDVTRTCDAKDRSFLERALRFLECASAAYEETEEKIMEKVDGLEDVKRFPSDRTEETTLEDRERPIIRHVPTRVPLSDLPTASSSTAQFGKREKRASEAMPFFYLATCPRLETVIVSIRGTSSTAGNDDLADFLMRDSEPRLLHETGDYVQFHLGILQAAEYVLDKIAHDLPMLLLKYRKKKVVFTGHSFGGGVAQVCGLLQREHYSKEWRKDIKVDVFTFAAPPVICEAHCEVPL